MMLVIMRQRISVAVLLVGMMTVSAQGCSLFAKLCPDTPGTAVTAAQLPAEQESPMARDMVYDNLQLITLDNGLRVAMLPRSSAPVVAVQVWINAGSAMETPQEAGIAHLIEHMLFKGSAGYPDGDMAALVEGSGGDINAWTSLENTVYHVTMSSAYAKTAVNILADAVQRPLFDPEELQQETLVVLEEIKRGKDDPSHSADEALFAMTFKKSPLGQAGHRLRKSHQGLYP